MERVGRFGGPTMRGIPLALAAALLASLAFNLVLYRRAAEDDVLPEHRPRQASAALPDAPLPSAPPASSPVSSSQLLTEIRQLRAELAAARGTPSSPSPAPSGDRPSSRKAPEEFPPAIALDPVVMNALAERDATRHASSRCCRDLNRVFLVTEVN